MTISAVQRAALARAVAGLRRVFEEDYAALAEGKFGIHLTGRRAGEVEGATALSLSSHDLSARDELVGVIEYLRGEGLSAKEAVERMVREAVFTTVNRLLAIRVAEAIGVLPPSLAEGSRSEGFAEAIEGFPLLRDADDSDGYWTYLQICGDELSHAVPRLFDRRHPLSALLPSAEALEEAVGILAGSALTGVWVEPEALGWSYQFFNTQDERISARESDDARALAIRTQFFTPRFVVDFLVENTLGRMLAESGIELQLPLLLGGLDDGLMSVDLEEISVLDPAVGSGHFLLGAYDILEKAWQAGGVDASEAAPRILGSLFGVDIDPRAAQVAQAALYFRARHAAPHAHLDPPVIVAARPLPRDPDVKREVLELLSPAVRDVVLELDDILSLAAELGSLLRPERRLRQFAEDRTERPQLGDQAPATFEEFEESVIAAMRGIADLATSGPAERLFAADSTDALRFVEICRRRYDVVLMNPPFGGIPDHGKNAIKRDYGPAAIDLFACFADRGRDLVRAGGYVGSIGSRAGFFLVKFEGWRRESVFPFLAAALDLGYGVADDAVVEMVPFVLSTTSVSGRAIFRRLLREADKEAAVLDSSRGDVFEVDPVEFMRIPRSPMAYWLPERVRALFGDSDPVSDLTCRVQHGAATADDFRFVRAWWEVDPRTVGVRWFPFAKGGEYSPGYSDIHLLVDWEDGARRICEHVIQRYPYLKGNPEWVVHLENDYFDPGFSWPVVTTSAFGPYVLPVGCVFGHAGNAALPNHDDAKEALGAVLMSRAARGLLQTMLSGGEATRSGTPVSKYESGVIASLPWPAVTPEVRANWLALVGGLRLLRGVFDETAHAFVSPSEDPPDRRADLGGLIRMSAQIDSQVTDAYRLGDEERAWLDDEQGPHPGEYPSSGVTDEDEFARLYLMSEGKLVDEALDRLGGARYLATKAFFVDRRLELLAHIFGANPEHLIELRDALGLVREDDMRSVFGDRVSYLVGAALGRWDICVGRDPSLAQQPADLFAALPACSPGMLVDDHGLPAIQAPQGYQILLPPDRILHDDVGHRWDVVSAMEMAAEALSDSPERELDEALRMLKAESLRSYLRGKFFQQHLGRYSKSRRKAPIYWYLAVPSKNWGLWVYAAWLSREQLFAISRAAQEKLRHISEQASQLRRELDAGGGRERRDRLEATEDLVRELCAFRDKAEAVAQSGWEPDLNDGIILNAAPLEDLFADARWRKDIAKHREKMEKGEYPWATVQRQYFDRVLS